MARSDAVSIELAKRRYSEALAAYTLDQWRSLAQDLGLQHNPSSPTTTVSSSGSPPDGPTPTAHSTRSRANGSIHSAAGAGLGRQNTDREIAAGLQNVTLSPGLGVPVA